MGRLHERYRRLCEVMGSYKRGISALGKVSAGGTLT